MLKNGVGGGGFCGRSLLPGRSVSMESEVSIKVRSRRKSIFKFFEETRPICSDIKALYFK